MQGACRYQDRLVGVDEGLLVVEPDLGPAGDHLEYLLQGVHVRRGSQAGSTELVEDAQPTPTKAM